MIVSVHVLACMFFRSRKKLLVSFFLLPHKWYRNFSSSEVSITSFFPVLRDESVLIVSEFLYKPFAFLSVILLVLLSTAVFLWEKMSWNMWKNAKVWVLPCSCVCFYMLVLVVILEYILRYAGDLGMLLCFYHLGRPQPTPGKERAEHNFFFKCYINECMYLMCLNPVLFHFYFLYPLNGKRKHAQHESYSP